MESPAGQPSTTTPIDGPVVAKTFCPEEIDNNPFHLPDAEAAAMAQEYVVNLLRTKCVGCKRSNR